ncbi:type VI secretion system baseplate subunit TssG [Rhizobium halophytocola]|uniref:Type VI secretion system protein ImpH n=1 Tax=Rhizobium halophytocola TaxID=735519 RepID=A0ABS4E675_9HYPH|nr:type VI secretion system baseplate subunit TssG [Rhizobium halophytocola]MBP1853450.1 type VI secretion system protein ImpH [Rhizobium halophytocola]
MKHEDLSGEAALASLLAEDPGRFEPTTAYRIAQTLAGDDALQRMPHIDVRPAALPVSGFRRRGDKVELRSTFSALVGALGSLPPGYNDLILKEERNRSHGLSSFIALFAERFADLFVAAGEKYRIARRIRWQPRAQGNTFARVLLSLTGFGTANLTETSNVEEETLLRYAGHFANRTRNAVNLEALLSDFTGLPIAVSMFQPRWITIPERERSRMGGLGAPRLGVDSVAGQAVRDLGSGFRLVVGPVGYDDYLTLSPGTERMREICALARLFVGSGLQFDVQVVLRKTEIPLSRMSGPQSTRLGWNSWARVAPAAEDSGEAVVRESQALAVVG